MTAFVVLSPLHFFYNLQLLNLIPSTPCFPTWHAMMPLSASSPIQLPTLPGTFTLRSTMALLLQLARSPLALYWADSQLTTSIYRSLLPAMRSIVPKPDCPDPVSIQAAMEEDLGPRSIPGIEPSTEEVTASILDPVGSLVGRLGSWASQAVGSLTSLAAPESPSMDHSSSTGLVREHTAPDTRALSMLNGDHGHGPLRSGAMGVRAPGESDRSERASPPTFADDLGQSPESSTESPPISRLNGPSDDAGSIATTTADTRPTTGPRRLSEARELAGRGDVFASVGPLRRVTTLSSFPAIFVAFSLSRTAAWVAIPLESLFLRTLALSYLAASKPQEALPNATALSSRILAPGADVEALRRISGHLSLGPLLTEPQFSAMAAALGLELLANLGLFEVAYLVVLRLGRGYFGWGQA